MLPQNLPPSAIRKSSRIICNRYHVIKKIGNGTFGTVYLVEDVYKNKDKKVLKEICVGEMSEQESQGVDREANLLSKLNHHNIVRMFESFMNEESFYIIMEYCEVGDLDRELKRWKTKGEIVPLQQVMDWFVQLIIAVQYIHSQKMLHRDLKCKNVFLTETKTVKIGDFGISRILTSTEYASTFTGTPYYMSPEVIKHDGYGSKSDIWSLGVILYEICELKRAFEGKNLMSVMMKIIQGNLPNISPERGGLADIFTKIMRSDPHDRPSSSQLLTEPIIVTHLSFLKQRLRGRRQSSAGSTSSSKSTDSSRKMTARERMRLEKQKKADEEAEQLKHLAQENYAANRARTAARRENEINRPNIIQSSDMGLDIKPLNPDIIKHDRHFCYSPRPNPASRGISAIHPEPKKPIIKKVSSEFDRQLVAIEKSLEFAAAEALSQQIRERNDPSLAPKNVKNHINSASDEVDGAKEDDEDSDQKEIEENSSNSTLDNFVEHLEDKSDLILTSTQENYKKESITSLRNLSLGFSDTEMTLSSSDDDVAELFETANEQCVLDIDSLELTAVSDIPEDPEEANTFYSFEEFEEDGPLTPRTPRYSRGQSVEYLVENHKDSQSFSEVRKSSSFEITNNKSVGADFNRSFPLDKFSNFERFNTREISQNHPEDVSSVQNSSQLTEKSSTIILRSDRIKTLRSKCRNKLGDELFEKIYDYLNDARFGEEVEEEEVIVQALRDWAPQLTSQCFLVDQLIYLEKQEMLASKLM